MLIQPITPEDIVLESVEVKGHVRIYYTLGKGEIVPCNVKFVSLIILASLCVGRAVVAC